MGLNNGGFPAGWPRVDALHLALAEPLLREHDTELSEADWHPQADHFLARWTRLGTPLKGAFREWCDSKRLLRGDRRGIWRIVYGRVSVGRPHVE